MQNDESPEFMRAWMSALELYDKTPSKEAAKLAFQVLQDLSLADIQRAIAIHLADPKAGHYPIKPADVRQIVEGSPDAQAERAWSRLESAVRRVGPWKSVAFDDPVLQGVVHEMGGWVKMGEMTEHDWKFRRQEFVRRYTDYVQRRAKPAETGLLHGLHGSNAVGGEQVELLGDEERARAIANVAYEGERHSTVKIADLQEGSGLEKGTEQGR